MNVIEAIKTRRSVRGYKPDPVPRQVIEGVLQAANQAPSALNTQPWEIVALAGKPLDDLRQANMQALMQGGGGLKDFAKDAYAGVYKDRQVALAKELFRLMGIAREDKEKRDLWMAKGFRFFDAPLALILTADKQVATTWAESDIGGLAQSICLAALEYGLGTCINGQGVMFPDLVRRITGLPETKNIYLCIAIGYPDDSFPANALVTAREELNAKTTWLGI